MLDDGDDDDHGLLDDGVNPILAMQAFWVQMVPQPIPKRNIIGFTQPSKQTKNKHFRKAQTIMVIRIARVK